MHSMEYYITNFQWRNYIDTCIPTTLQVASKMQIDLPLINSASKGLANHVSEFSIGHLTPSVTTHSKVLRRNTSIL